MKSHENDQYKATSVIAAVRGESIFFFISTSIMARIKFNDRITGQDIGQCQAPQQRVLHTPVFSQLHPYLIGRVLESRHAEPVRDRG